MVRGLLAALVCTTAGCSLLMRGPPDRPDPARPPDCHSSQVAPGLDTALAVVGAGFAVIALIGGTTCDGDDLCQEITTVFALTGGATAAVWGLSAHRGYRTAERCHRAEEAHRARVAAPAR